MSEQLKTFPNSDEEKMSHSQKSATFTVTSITSVLTMQYYIKACNKYLKN